MIDSDVFLSKDKTSVSPWGSGSTGDVIIACLSVTRVCLLDAWAGIVSVLHLSKVSVK